MFEDIVSLHSKLCLDLFFAFVHRQSTGVISKRLAIPVRIMSESYMEIVPNGFVSRALFLAIFSGRNRDARTGPPGGGRPAAGMRREGDGGVRC